MTRNNDAQRRARKERALAIGKKELYKRERARTHVPRPLSQHHTKRNALEANRNNRYPSYVRQAPSYSPFNWWVVRRRR